MSPTLSSRRLCSLATSELFLLCSLRLMAQAARENRAVERTCREGFEAARLTPAHAQHLSAALRTIETATGRTLDVRDTRCAEVAPDEEQVLQVILLMQHENEFGARRVLWRLLPPAAARVVLVHLGELARGMAGAGLMLPHRAYALRPCPAEALAARRLGAVSGPEPAEAFWLN